MEREYRTLDGLWRFQPDPLQEGSGRRYPREDYDDSRWPEAQVPNVFERCLQGMDFYRHIGWFRRRFTVPGSWQGQRTILRFEGANYRTRVWVNGLDVGGNDDGFLRFDLPIERALHSAGSNVVAVRVDNRERIEDVPGLHRGWRPFGGILRSVGLIATNPLHLEAVQVSGTPGHGDGTIELKALACNGRQVEVRSRLTVELFPRGEAPVASWTLPELRLASGEIAPIVWKATVKGIRPWSPATPNLYLLRLTLQMGDVELDTAEERFGFRSICTNGTQLLLNGEPIRLKGFNRHEDSAERDQAVDTQTAQRDLETMKSTGANFVRLCHYPHDPSTLDLCDELGLLAMEEIPLYWWTGYEEGEVVYDQRLEAAKRQLRALVARDFNHPAVVFWSVSNENRDDHPEVREGNATLIRLVKSLDCSRLVMHVADRWHTSPAFCEDDIICCNWYPTWAPMSWGRGETLYDLDDGAALWQRELTRLHDRFPDRPILISEFGYPCLAGVSGGAAGEDAQAEAIAKEYAAIRDLPFVCGATVWCWADHAWPLPGYFPDSNPCYLRTITVSPFGVVTRDRRHKTALSVLKGLWQNQIDRELAKGDARQ